MRLLRKLLFWQPRIDYLKLLLTQHYGNAILIILNYLIWPFFALLSLLLVIKSANIFWQIFTATLLSEIIERLIKSRIFWPRPMSLHHDPVPHGLVPSWYNTGSFPSGHTAKATYFFLFALQYQLVSPSLFISFTVPLIAFRILIGFHYPIDILGGFLIGTTTWALSHSLAFPAIIVDPISVIFNHVF